jgi:uncharacterized repeat protein (TIGR01451 family)
MFEKLLSALPFNPGTIQQLSFYANRMRQEEAIRRVGLVFIVLAFLIQFFAFTSPPVPTLAASPNDLIDGGFSSAAQAATDCQSNLEDYGTILSNYGISCSDVAAAQTISINSDSWNKQLWSMGRDPANIAGETPVSTPGLSYPLYERYLWGWDSPGTSSTYQVLNVTVTGGQTFFLMYACGNLVSIGFPQPVQQKPNITLSKTTVPGYPVANSTVKPGTELGFRIYFNNLGGPASNVQVNDPEPANTTFVSQGTGASTNYGYSDGNAYWNWPSMPAGASNWYVDVYYKVNENTASGTRICNTGAIKTAQTPLQDTNEVCFTVHVNAPPAPITPKPPLPKPICEEQTSSSNTSTCIATSKSAANLTQNIANANDTTANAGDIIKYTLSATNKGSSPVTKYLFSDSLAYVLTYSSVVQTNGGSLSSNNDISWPAVTINPGKTATEQFEVKVDNPIPETPTSTSDPNYFNLKMTNTFGNTITINLPSTPVAVLQTTSLVNTGPGTSIFIGAAVVVIAGFFFYRSRLIVKESKIAIIERSGGM